MILAGKRKPIRASEDTPITHVWVSRLALAVVLGLGLMHYWDGWLIWGALLLFMGVRHPPPLDP